MFSKIFKEKIKLPLDRIKFSTIRPQIVWFATHEALLPALSQKCLKESVKRGVVNSSIKNREHSINFNRF